MLELPRLSSLKKIAGRRLFKIDRLSSRVAAYDPAASKQSGNQIVYFSLY